MSLVDIGLSLYPSSIGMSSTGGFTLDAAEELITFIVQAPKTGTLKKIGWRVYASTSPVLTCRVSIETVADVIGQPVATTDAGKTLYAANAVSADITNPAADVRFDAINGTTGISVTKGDLLAITIRVIAYTSGSIAVHYNQYGGIWPMSGLPMSRSHGYTQTYAASTWTVYYTPHITLEYDGEFAVCPFTLPAQHRNSHIAYNSSSNPDRRGLKFQAPYGFTAKGVVVYLDCAVDVDLIIYDADEYTVMTGFPITLDKDKRANNSAAWHYIEFPTEPQFAANANYRMVLLPKDTTNIVIICCVPADDDTILGATAYPEGLKTAYTTFNGTPTSGSHAWTDDTAYKMCAGLLVNKIDIPAGTGGLLTHPGMSGGMRG